MKTLKVKFILFSLTTLLVVSFLASCEQEVIKSSINEVDRTEQLQLDPNYTTLISWNNQLLNEISNAMAAKNVTGEDLKNMYVNGQNDLLEAFFAGTQVESIMNEIVPIANQLSNDYSDLITASEGFDETILEGFNNLENMSLESRCSPQFTDCQVASIAALVTCIVTTPLHLKALCYSIYYATLGLCHTYHC